MIYGIGSDIVNIKRLEKGSEFLNRFIKRCLTEREQQDMACRGLADMSVKISYVAKRFAAKEAVVKALGTGFRDGIYLSDIEISSDTMGKPFARLSGNAEKYVAQLPGGKNARIHISLSDDYPFAFAVAIVEL